MKTPYRCALIGFSAYELSSFDSFFKLTSRRVRGCEIFDDHTLCNIAIVNSDDSAALAAFIATAPKLKVVLIGKTDVGTGWATLARPIKLMAVLNEIDRQLGGTVMTPLSGASVIKASPPAAPEAATRVAEETPQVPAATAIATNPTYNSPTPANVVATPIKHIANTSNTGRTSDFAGLEASTMTSAPPAKGRQFDDILVVDDSNIALKFMQDRLHRFGFRPELASSGEQAMARLADSDFKFVFLDVMMDGMDGYQTCRAIKQSKYRGATPPVVVMLTSRGGTIDKIRGTLAGCDAYLTKPLNETDLLAILSKHEPKVKRSFQSTIGPTLTAN